MILLGTIIVILNITGCSTKAEYVIFDRKYFNKEIEVPRGIEKKQNTKTRQESNSALVVSSRIDARFEYGIRPYDRISINVYNNPELNTATTKGLLVNSNGNIKLPLIGEVSLEGLSQTEAQAKLENMYSEYLKNPSIQVEVLNKRAFVLGEVNNPGPIELRNEQIPLLQLLAVAGDLTKGADRRYVVILRNSSGNSIQTEVVSIANINSVRMASHMINPNDVVYVMPKDVTKFNNKVEEISPVFRLISNAITSILGVKILTQ